MSAPRSGRSAITSATEASENEIQRAVFDNFKLRKAKGVFAFHPKNGSSDMRGRRAGVYAGLGVVPGIPDVLVSRRFERNFVEADSSLSPRYGLWALELKRQSRRGKKLTPHETKQAACRDEMAQCGWITGVAYGIDEALEWLENQGLLRGRKC